MNLRIPLAILLLCVSVTLPTISWSQTLTDIDGNTYDTVNINDQVWMAQNLNVSKFKNGDPIAEVKTDEAWEKAALEKKPAWCYYEYTADHGNVYGKLYNWYAVTDKRGLAPKGWHIPSDKEWNQLSNFLGGDELSGKKLKEKGASHWKSPNKEATNESGFSGIPGGFIYSFGGCVHLGNTAYWWTSVEDGDDTAILYSMTYDSNALSNFFLNKGVGLSVRCVKD